MRTLIEFSLGAALGLITGVIAVEFPTLGLLIVIVVVVIGVQQKPGSVWFPGALVAAGIPLFVLAVATGINCAKTEDFCGHTNVFPLAALGLVVAVLGAIASARAWRHRAQI